MFVKKSMNYYKKNISLCIPISHMVPPPSHSPSFHHVLQTWEAQPGSFHEVITPHFCLALFITSLAKIKSTISLRDSIKSTCKNKFHIHHTITRLQADKFDINTSIPLISSPTTLTGIHEQRKHVNTTCSHIPPRRCSKNPR